MDSGATETNAESSTNQESIGKYFERRAWMRRTEWQGVCWHEETTQVCQKDDVLAPNRGAADPFFSLSANLTYFNLLMEHGLIVLKKKRKESLTRSVLCKRLTVASWTHFFHKMHDNSLSSNPFYFIRSTVWQPLKSCFSATDVSAPARATAPPHCSLWRCYLWGRTWRTSVKKETILVSVAFVRDPTLAQFSSWLSDTFCIIAHQPLLVWTAQPKRKSKPIGSFFLTNAPPLSTTVFLYHIFVL